MLVRVERVVVLGRGGAGKTTFALQLGRVVGLPVLELDQHFWSPDLTPKPARQWAQVQSELAAADRWVMDGDLGPYDVLAPRLSRADMVVVLDFGLLRCLWRAVRRSREGADFWWWVTTWRRRSRPIVLHAIAVHGPAAEVHLVRTPRQLRRLLGQLAAAACRLHGT